MEWPVASGCIDQVNHFQVVVVLSFVFEEHNCMSQGPTRDRWGHSGKVAEGSTNRGGDRSRGNRPGAPTSCKTGAIARSLKGWGWSR